MTDLTTYLVEELDRDGAFVLSRATGEGRSVLLLAPAADPPARGAIARLEHAFALRDEVDGAWAARPLELLHEGTRRTLVMEDPGVGTLARQVGAPMSVEHFLRLAIGLTSALGSFHARGLIHRDLKAANVLVDPVSGRAWLTGIGLATRLPRQRQAPEPFDVITGTLSHLAPERTGRMNRSTDSRSDLYSVGVVFYEMLTGALPFTATSAIDWVHCHIARTPLPPHELRPDLPEAISSLVVKLLAKAAEDRYQTAAGLEADLRRCLDAWEGKGRVDTFALGERDAADHLLIPETLYGREAEIGLMLAAFDRVVTAGTTELVLVSGYSGIGKSSVVNELHKALVPPRGLFAAGKFDQYKRGIPYATLAQAFSHLVRQILAQSAAEVAHWKREISEALGPNGQLIVSLIPEVEHILGKQPAGRRSPAGGDQGSLPARPAPLHRRLRAAGASAGALPRRSAVARRRHPGADRAPDRLAGRHQPAPHRRLPRQRGRRRPPAGAGHAELAPRGRSAARDRAGAARRARRRIARRRRAAL